MVFITNDRLEAPSCRINGSTQGHTLCHKNLFLSVKLAAIVLRTYYVLRRHNNVHYEDVIEALQKQMTLWLLSHENEKA